MLFKAEILRGSFLRPLNQEKGLILFFRKVNLASKVLRFLLIEIRTIVHSVPLSLTDQKQRKRVWELPCSSKVCWERTELRAARAPEFSMVPSWCKSYTHLSSKVQLCVKTSCEFYLKVSYFVNFGKTFKKSFNL